MPLDSFHNKMQAKNQPNGFNYMNSHNIIWLKRCIYFTLQLMRYLYTSRTITYYYEYELDSYNLLFLAV